MLLHCHSHDTERIWKIVFEDPRFKEGQLIGDDIMRICVDYYNTHYPDYELYVHPNTQSLYFAEPKGTPVHRPELVEAHEYLATLEKRVEDKSKATKRTGTKKQKDEGPQQEKKGVLSKMKDNLMSDDDSQDNNPITVDEDDDDTTT